MFGWPGGVAAVNEPGAEVRVYAGRAGREIFKLTIPTYPSLFQTLRNKGFPVLGASFVTSSEELEGLRPLDFRSMSSTKGWLVWDAVQQWRQIAFASGKSGRQLGTTI